MILEIALGVALGLLIYANLRGLIAMGLLAALFALLLVLLGVAAWVLYSALEATKSFLPLLRLSGQPAAIFGFIFSVLVNILFALACGQVLEQKTSLSRREATAFGVLFYALFLFSALSLPVAVEAFTDGQVKSALFYLLTIVSVWALVVRQCILRNRRQRQQVAA